MFRFLLCGFEKMKKEMGVAGRSWFSSVVGPIGSEFRSWREEGRGRKDSRKGGKMERWNAEKEGKTRNQKQSRRKELTIYEWF